MSDISLEQLYLGKKYKVKITLTNSITHNFTQTGKLNNGVLNIIMIRLIGKKLIT